VLILLSWWSTIKFLARAAVEHFIVGALEFRISHCLAVLTSHPKAQPEVASSFYKKGAKLLIHYILISVWGLLTALFGSVRPTVPVPLFPFPDSHAHVSAIDVRRHE